MQHTKWQKIAIVSSTESLHFETRLELAKQLETASMEVLKPAALEPGSVKDVTLSQIRRSGFRIVLVLSYDADTQTVALVAQREGMLSGWAWLVAEESLTVSGMAGWLWFRPFLASEAMQTFAKQVSNYSKSYFDL